MASQSCYDVLGVPPTASWKEVRQAYYQLAMRYHPDRLATPGGTGDEAKFQQCAQAYRVLREEELRRRYERAVSARHAAGLEPADVLRATEEAGAPAVEATAAGPRRGRPLWRYGLVSAAACIALALGGWLVYALFARDTWEREHRDSLVALGSEARRLAADGRFGEATERYDEIRRFAGERELLDPDLRLIVGEARTVSAHAPDLREWSRRERDAVESEKARGYARASRELGDISLQSQRYGGDPVAESIARRAADEAARDAGLAQEAERQAVREREAAEREEQLRAVARRETAAREAFSAAMAGMSDPGGRLADAVHQLYVAADLGEPRAMYTLGSFYESAEAGNWAPAEAAKWYAKAAAAGNRDAMNALGHLYLDGRGVGQDDRKALEWLKKAADAGDAGAMYAVGTLFESGRALRQAQDSALRQAQDRAGAANLEEAAAWYRKAEASGEVRARERLADLAARNGDAGRSPASRSSE